MFDTLECGERVLKPDAVPTIFSHRPAKKIRRPPSNRNPPASCPVKSHTQHPDHTYALKGIFVLHVVKNYKSIFKMMLCLCSSPDSPVEVSSVDSTDQNSSNSSDHSSGK